MITRISVNNYRSIFDVTLALGPLNVITGANGSGKSNVYRALKLLAETAYGGVIRSLAAEGGLHSTFWAGPERLSRQMKAGTAEIQGTVRTKAKRLQLGFATEQFGYAISLGLPTPTTSAFALDPEIKQEAIWSGDYYRPSSALIKREGGVIKTRAGRSWNVVRSDVAKYDSIFDQFLDPINAGEVLQLREEIRSWRFYDNFRSDKHAPARSAHIGTRTPVLHNDGRDVAAAIQTIIEIGDGKALHEAIDHAFPGCRLEVVTLSDGRFSLNLHQPGLLRPLQMSELSDGTLRYILWVAALLTPRPPSLMVLNEPETSLHPDLLPALAQLISDAAERSQVWVVSHANRLVAALNQNPNCHSIELHKEHGQTEIAGYSMLDEPAWHWPTGAN